ncbi:hypothetical protein B9G55_21120 [Saccharibacillus sp. O16]|nr:hypothetical protein B9G55_21120 [Saccharibacillus sp. O16]
MKYKKQCVTCIECTGLVESLYYNAVKIKDLTSVSIHIVGYNLLTEYKCTHCYRILKTGDLYFNDDSEYAMFIEAASITIAFKLSREIYCCGNCDGYDLERHVYNVNKNEPHNLIAEDKYGTHIASFLAENYVPEHMFDAFSKLLVCQGCAFGTPDYPYDRGDNLKFDIYDKIYFQEELDTFWGRNVIRFANKFDILIGEAELEEFREFLKNKPMLALMHQTGKKLYDAVMKNFALEDCVVVSRDEILFRGRVRYRDQPAYLTNQLKSPPLGKSSHGRYNSIGSSVLYCCDTKEALPYELHPSNGQIIDIIVFKTNKEFRLFDMNSAFEKFEGFVASPNLENNLLKQEYLLTNFISSCCEDVGYEGIKYSGVGNNSMDYWNYALFVNEKIWDFVSVNREIEQYEIGVTYNKVDYRCKTFDEMLNFLTEN